MKPSNKVSNDSKDQITAAKYPRFPTASITGVASSARPMANYNSVNHMMNNSYTFHYNPEYRVTRLPNPPSFLHHGSLQFVIMDAPTDDNLETYIKELETRSVHCVVRTCEPTYSDELLREKEMQVIDVPFPDGQPPSTDIVDRWLEIVNKENFRSHRPVAVHCVAGLGRAPVLVAIALIEISGMDPVKAINMIRMVRRGAINQKQYAFLKNYQRKNKYECCTVL
jgi:protein tyrosine phosphatase type 4A